MTEKSQADGSGNGSGGHGKAMREAGKVVEKRALADAEFVLFINNQ